MARGSSWKRHPNCKKGCNVSPACKGYCKLTLGMAETKPADKWRPK